MRPSLRRTLIDLVVAAAPLVATGCLSEHDRCWDDRERSVRLPEPPPADLAAFVDACEADEATCNRLCSAVLMRFEPNHSSTSCEVSHDATGHTVVVGYEVSTNASGCPIPGRRPAGLARARKPRAGLAATHLARSAWFEAASVHAFIGLARQLTRHGAPVALRDAARRSAVDEVHHARLMGDLARARGATPPPVEIELQGKRSLESIAIENATEGVVGETWAALIAFWQARHAADPTVRATYAKIAEDELRHAELSIEIDAWVRTKLRPAARCRVDAARARAIRRLSRGVGARIPAALVGELGMPDATAMRKLFTDARARAWL
ncbi:MAG: putative lipoprotein [Myxococcales bacterium]|nr:putative lipoprotein [Myxococcales bacterium]